MACFEPYQLFGTIITWLLISRSGYRRANLLFDAHNVAPSARLPRACRRGQWSGGYCSLSGSGRWRIPSSCCRLGWINTTIDWINTAITRSVRNWESSMYSISQIVKGRKKTPDRYRSSIDDRSRCVGVRLAKRILDRTAPLFLSSQVPIYRSRWIDSAINKLNCIMDLSKRVRVPHLEGIVMYMWGIYRFFHLFAMSKENTYSLSSGIPLGSQKF